MNKAKRTRHTNNKACNLYKKLRCPKCNKLESHFVPPSFGEEGFYICEAKK